MMNKMFTFFRESETARFFISLGIILIVFGVIVFVITIKNQNYVKTEAIVTKTELTEEEHTDIDGNIVDATYRVFIKYTVDEKEYEEELGEMSGYKEGDKTTIYYNPKNPTEITQVKSLLVPIAIIVGGIASLTGGVISGMNRIKRYKKMKEQEKGWKNE